MVGDERQAGAGNLGQPQELQNLRSVFYQIGDRRSQNRGQLFEIIRCIGGLLDKAGKAGQRVLFLVLCILFHLLGQLL